MRVEFRHGAVTIRPARMLPATILSVTALVAIVSCGASPLTGAPTATPPPNPPVATPAAPQPAPTPDPDQRICQAYAAAAPSARTPLDAMRTQAVLVPFIDFIQLGTHEVAARVDGSNSPAIVAAMREVVAAQEDIDQQGQRALAGANVTETPVRLDPTRLSAALDAADQACEPVLKR